MALPGTSTALYLGTAEQAPDIQIKANWEPVHNDVAGLTAYDFLSSGTEGIISVTLTRWNDPVYAALAARSSVGGIAGRESAAERGTLMMTEGIAAPLWIQFPFGLGGALAHPAMATLPPGYHFYAAFLESPDRLNPGVRAYKVHLQWHCIAVYSPGATIVSQGNGAIQIPGTAGFFLYDRDMSGAAIPN